MTPASQLVFSRLFLPLPLDPLLAVDFIERLATDRFSDEIVLEVRADRGGIQHLIGCAPTQVQHLRRLLGELIPGTLITGLDGYLRPTLESSGRLHFHPGVLPLSTADPLRISRALYTALARRFQPNEAVALQVVLGVGHPPQQVPHRVSDPSKSWLWAALTGVPNGAGTEVRNRIRDRAANFRIDCTIRVGVTAAASDRRRQLATEMMSALSLAQSPGVRMEFVRESASRMNEPQLPRRHAAQLAVVDIVPLIGWPLGDAQLPGMPPLHPKLVRAHSSVHSTDRVFATSSVPGDSRQLGISEADGLFHGVAIGPTGSGKTNTLYHLIEADIRAGRSVVVLDPKDQMPDHLAARIPKNRWEDVVQIDPSEENPIGFNPLDTNDRDPDVVADGILAVFARSFASSWGPRTEDIFSASLRTLARASSIASPNTLIDLPKLWTNPRFRVSQLAQIDDDPGLLSFWSAYEDLSPAAQANWIASPMNKLRSILLRPAAVKILGQAHAPFRMRDAFRDNKIVLISLNEGLIGPLTAELIGSLVIAELWQATQERAAEKDAAKHAAFVYVDEADRFMHLPISLGDALARSRSLSVGWFLAVQYWDQLPKEMKSAIKNNARNKIAWAMSSDDDARTFARLAPGLSELDFMQLGRFDVYANLVSNGSPTGWASMHTLPPSAAIHDPDEVRAVSRALYAPKSPPNAVGSASHAQTSETPAEPTTSLRPGQKRRQS
jgi:hypothetical protein